MTSKPVLTDDVIQATMERKTPCSSSSRPAVGVPCTACCTKAASCKRAMTTAKVTDLELSEHSRTSCTCESCVWLVIHGQLLFVEAIFPELFFSVLLCGLSISSYPKYNAHHPRYFCASCTCRGSLKLLTRLNFGCW